MFHSPLSNKIPCATRDSRPKQPSLLFACRKIAVTSPFCFRRAPWPCRLSGLRTKKIIQTCQVRRPLQRLFLRRIPRTYQQPSPTQPLIPLYPSSWLTVRSKPVFPRISKSCRRRTVSDRVAPHLHILRRTRGRCEGPNPWRNDAQRRLWASRFNLVAGKDLLQYSLRALSLEEGKHRKSER